ncbi:MAG: heme ABC transporter permease CcmC [Pseudomonadota bacterium]
MKRFWHQLGSPRWLYLNSASWLRFLGWGAAALLVCGSVWGLAIAPADYQQGNSYRIMFVHVPTALLSQSCFLLLATAGVVLLVWRMKMADVVAQAAVPVGMAITALALFSGAVWGRPTWGAWWVSDARTVSTLVLLFLYFALFALRQSIPRAEAAGRACAVLAIVGAINIPIIKYSVEWWNTMHQVSSLSVGKRPAMPASMYLPLLLNILAFYLFFAYLLLLRVRTGILRQESGARWVRELVT